MFDIAVSHAKLSQRELVRPEFDNRPRRQLRPGHRYRQTTTNQPRNGSRVLRGRAPARPGPLRVLPRRTAGRGDASFLQTSKDCADYFLANLPETFILRGTSMRRGTGSSRQIRVRQSSPPTGCYSSTKVTCRSRGQLRVSRLRAPNLERGMRAPSKPAGEICYAASGGGDSRAGVSLEHGALSVDLGEGETIVNGATINNFEFAPRRWANHGLVYADYFFLLCGNKLLEMGVGQLILRPE